MKSPYTKTNIERRLSYVHCDKIFHWSIRNLFGDDFGGLQTAETKQAKEDYNYEYLAEMTEQK